MTRRRKTNGQIYLEFHVVGASQKVSAIDGATGIEVSVTGPTAAPRDQISKIAVQKLQRKIAREQN